MDDGQGTKIMV